MTSRHPSIQRATTPEQLHHCYPVIKQLRPHLDESAYLSQVARQEKQGYLTAFAEHESRVVAVAGYRFVEYLAWGSSMYVDDLVTCETARSGGCGGALFDWLVEQAKENGCRELHLDSGVQRFDAHRFYLRKRMNITSHHFALPL